MTSAAAGPHRRRRVRPDGPRAGRRLRALVAADRPPVGPAGRRRGRPEPGGPRVVPSSRDRGDLRRRLAPAGRRRRASTCSTSRSRTTFTRTSTSPLPRRGVTTSARSRSASTSRRRSASWPPWTRPTASCGSPASSRSSPARFAHLAYAASGALGDILDVRSQFAHSSDIDRGQGHQLEAARRDVRRRSGSWATSASTSPTCRSAWATGRRPCTRCSTTSSRSGPDRTGSAVACDTWDNALLACRVPTGPTRRRATVQHAVGDPAHRARGR